MELCKKGTWNESMCVETVMSMVTVDCDLKRIRHRVANYIQARLGYVSAMFNILINLSPCISTDTDPYQMSIAEFSL